MSTTRHRFHARRAQLLALWQLGMTFVIATTVLVSALAYPLSAASGATASPRVVDVPLTVKQLSSGSDLHAIVIVNIRVANGNTVPVQLDTGSSGLVILTTAVGPDARNTGQTAPVNYLSGGVNGAIDEGKISIGGLATPPATQFIAFSPKANPGMAASFRRAGTDGILGIAVGEPEAPKVYSPLLQLKAPYWKGFTLRLPRTGTGSLEIGQTHANVDSVKVPMQQPFVPTKFLYGVPAHQKDMVLCWSYSGGGAPACGDTDIDLGSPQPVFDPDALTGAPETDSAVITPGTLLTAATPSGTPVWSYKAGTTAATDVTVLIQQGETQFNTGINFFFQHVVTYDVVGGEFYFAPV